MDVSPDEGQAEGPAKVRHSRWKSLAPIAALALLAAGFGIWQLLDRDGSDYEVHITGPGIASTGPVLEWTEFDPGLGDSDFSGFLEPLGDGRVLVTSLILEDNDGQAPGIGIRSMVTENGFDWFEVPMPSGITPYPYALSGNRWLVAGRDIAGAPQPVVGESAGSSSQAISGYRAFFSDDQGADWTELEFDPPLSALEESSTPDGIPVVSAALTSGNHMVLVLQSREVPKARIFASDGEAFEQVAEYDGSISGRASYGSAGTPAGFSLQLYIENETEQELPQVLTLTSPDGRNWSESDPAPAIAPTTLGPDGSLWRTAWLDAGYGLHRFDREGNLTTQVAFDNSLPFWVSAGPSGLVVNAMTVPGTDLYTLPNQRIAKEGYELQLNEPEGGFTLWDLDTGTAVHECGREEFWDWGLALAENTCQVTHPDVGADMDAVVLVFEDSQTGARLVSFTRRELLPTFPLWVITGLDSDGFEAQHWLGFSADGVEWGWQSPTDAFRIDSFEPEETSVHFAVGDGFVLARVLQYPLDGLPQNRWFIAQVP